MQRLVIAYAIILGSCILITTFLGRYRVRHELDNEYFTIGAQVISLLGGFVIYLVYVKIQTYRKSRNDRPKVIHLK